MKSNRGISVMDIVIAITILSMFVGVIGTLFYQITYNNQKIKLNGFATYYAVKVAEDIDMMEYDNVTNDLNSTLIDTYDLPDIFTININVENYNKDNASLQDILKIATIEVKYTCLNQEEIYTLRKLKVKE